MPRKTEDKFARERQRMVESDLRGRGIADEAVLKAMSNIHREQFVPEKYRSLAYTNGPLPIGSGQTISQPYIVALMTESLRLNKNCDVLELGTGSGYQTAILSSLAKTVYTIERDNQLCESAQAVLARLGMKNIEFYIGDGSRGWPDQRTFERIIITAAAPRIPQPLIDQLTEGGVLVAPVGSAGAQRLIVCEKETAGTTEKALCEVRFVRLIGDYGFEQ